MKINIAFIGNGLDLLQIRRVLDNDTTNINFIILDPVNPDAKERIAGRVFAGVMVSERAKASPKFEYLYREVQTRLITNRLWYTN